MLRTIIGALVGKEIDQRDGRGGVKGAMIGGLAARAISRTGPFGLLLGGGYVAKKMYDRRKAARVTQRRPTASS